MSIGRDKIPHKERDHTWFDRRIVRIMSAAHCGEYSPYDATAVTPHVCNFNLRRYVHLTGQRLHDKI
jgi:hypothetical protein